MIKLSANLVFLPFNCSHDRASLGKRAPGWFRLLAAALLCAVPMVATGTTPSAPAATTLAPAAVDISGALTSTQAGGAMLPMVVGHSMFLNTAARLRRVYVSNPAVLDSYTANPRQIVITAKAAGVSSLVLWDETGRSESHLIVASLDVAGLRISVGQAFPLDRIIVESQEDNISLSGPVFLQTSIDAALKMAGVYSKNVVNAMLLAPAHQSQVRLKVRIIEIDRSKIDQFGLNFFGGPKNPSGVTTGQFPVTTSVTGASSSGAAPGGTSLTISDPLNLFLFNSSLNVGVTIRDLASKDVLQILAEPTITTMSGVKASFLSGGEFPFPIAQGGAIATVTIQFRPYGVKLDFTPLVNADGTILLKVAPEVSALDYTNAVNISGYTIPALSTRRAETEVELRDGQSFAISGLLDHRTTDVLSRVPVAGSLPILGSLFRSKDIKHSVVELLVIVTPTIVDPLTGPLDNPAAPKFVIPLLDNGKFDEKMRGVTKPYAADPLIH